MAGKEIWAAAASSRQIAMVQPEFVKRYCFYSLVKMLDEAQDATVEGDSQQAIKKLRELQVHCEKMIGVLAPEQKRRLKLVDFVPLPVG
jgi:hypothetical protein